MIAKRIIPCLDVSHNEVVKGVRFQELQKVASPVELAKYYSENGADELVFYDIKASVEQRSLFTEILKETARKVFIPLTVGGGISSLADFDRVLKSGADKVSVNSGAIRRKELIEEAANRYGNQCVVLSVDVKKIGDEYHLFTGGGRTDTGIEALSWIKYAVDHGAGEVVVNSIDTDGVKGGYDLPLLTKVCDLVEVPIIASGGAGKTEDFTELFKQLPGVDGALAASVFHYGNVNIKELKETLATQDIPVRV
ncbi:MAG: imidazole glycerol phosphate synthase subunit HisF [Lachnospiraceae bacterium]|nr:imidazole glycerol phosphate synthase subunit HisF [Lachnospiraceae bacterium]